MQLVVELITVKKPGGHFVGVVAEFEVFRLQCDDPALQGRYRVFGEGELQTGIFQAGQGVQQRPAVANVFGHGTEAIGGEGLG